MEKNNSDFTLVAENQKLKIAVEELSILNDIATAITSTQSLEKIIALMVQKCIKHLKVEQGAVMIFDEQDSNNPFQTMIRKQDSAMDILPYRFDSQLTGWMIKNKSALLINDLKNDKRFNFSGEAELPVKTILSVPMSLKGRMIGLLSVFNKKSETGFSPGDQRLLSIIAAQSAQVLENARLNQKEQDLIKMEEEFRMAKEIQLNILPKEIPKIERYDIHAINIPAREVGGDYYDFIKLPGERMAFCLGDITGKGLPAAMLMANLQATLRGQSFTQNTVKDSVKNSNILLFNSTASNRFATVFYGVLDYSNNSITYCNAGHDAPIDIKDGQITRLTEGGLLLGSFDFAEFEEATRNIDAGELIVIYSDGVTEAMNRLNQEFGEEKFISLIKSNQNLSAKELNDLILNELKTHTGNVPQSDDITLMIIKRNS